MIVLSDPSAGVSVKLGVAVTTNPLEVLFAYVDSSAAQPFAQVGGNLGVSTLAATPVIFPPPVGTSRGLRYFSVFNADTVSATVTVQSAPGARTIFKAALAVGESMVYNLDTGWQVYGVSGARKIVLLSAAPTIGIGAGNDAGVASTYALSDHNHTIRETSGPQDLTMGAVRVGDVMSRVGNVFVGKTVLSNQVTADVNSTVVALADVPGLSIAIPKAGYYIFLVIGTYNTAAATTGLRIAYNYTGTLTQGGIHMTVQTLPAAAHIIESFSATVVNTGIGSLNGITGVSGFWYLTGHVQVTTAGNLVIRSATEIAASQARVVTDTSIFCIEF